MDLEFNLNQSPAVSDDRSPPNYKGIKLKDGTRTNSSNSDAASIPEIDFRGLVDSADVPETTYITHAIHKHPAIFIPHIPRHIIESFTSPLNSDGEVPIILDPFSGSGTSGLEAKLLGRHYLGVEINPLSKLVSDVATSPIPPTLLERFKRKIIGELQETDNTYYIEYDVEFLDNTEKEHWFRPDAIKGLTRIRKVLHEFNYSSVEVRPDLSQEAAAIDDLGVSDDEIRNRVFRWFTLMMANTVFQVSNADPNVSKAHKSKKMRKKIKNNDHPPDPVEVYEGELESTQQMLIELWNRVYNTRIPGGNNQENMSYWEGKTAIEQNRKHQAEVDIRLDDAREFDYPEYHESIDLAITSPPYINAMNYYRGTKLRLFWIHDFLEEEFNAEKLRKSIVGTNSAEIKGLNGELPFTLKDHWTGKSEAYRRTDLPQLDEDILEIHNSSLSEARKLGYVTWKFFVEDMVRALTRTYEHLKPGAHFFFLIGENTIGGRRIESYKFIADIAQNLGKFEGHGGDLQPDDGYRLVGFAWDEITNRDLFQGRNHTSGVIEGEWVVILQKPA